MQEYQCSECGYKKLEKEEMDIMLELPFFGSYGSTNMIPFVNATNWTGDIVCPNCGKAKSWKPIINNDNF